MITGKINDIIVSIYDQQTIPKKSGNGITLIRTKERLTEVFLDEQGVSDGNGLSAIQVDVESERERIIRQRFRSSTIGIKQSESGQKVKIVKAPMPGMVKSVLIEAGSVVTKNTTILILEAMKMENSIVASVNGVVKKVSAQAGNSIDKNAPICEIQINE